MKTIQPPSIRPTVRGLVLALAVTTLSSLTARAVPYASGIVSNDTTHQVSFILNQDAQGVTVLRDGGSPVAPGTTKGAHSFDMTGFTSYQIIVTGNTAKAWTQISSDSLVQSKYYSPRGVMVDRNSQRSTFGRIIVAEGLGGTPSAGGRTTTDGLYILSADQGDVLGQGNTAYAGGVNWTTGGSSSPFKVSMNSADPTGQDYTIYISDWTDPHSGIWTADALNPTTAFNELLSNVGRASSGLVAGLHGSIPCGPWVEGIGVDRNMYTVDEDYNLGDIMRYDIGTTTSGYATTPTTVIDGPAVNGLMDVVRAKDGSWWLATYRYTDSDTVSSLMRFPDGVSTPSWRSGPSTIPLNLAYGSIDIYDEQNLLVLGSNASKFWIIDISNPDSPVLVQTMAHTGTTIRDVGFDAAGNIYVVSPSSETLRIYSPGGLTIATTKSDKTFSVFTPDNVRVTATDADAAETGLDPATFTITRSGGPTKDLQVMFTLTGSATSNVDYTVSVQSPFTFAQGMTSTNITITPVDDTEREDTETVVLGLVSDPGYNVASPSAATAKIVDNDLVMRYWDTNSITTGTGVDPSGTWGTENFWSTDPNGEAATAAWPPGAAAVFSAGTDAASAYTVTVSSPQSVDHIEFEEGSVTLDGNTLNLANFSPTTVGASAGNTWLNCVLAGTNGFTYAGSGTLFLGGANTYSGATVISNGYVVPTASERIPDSSALYLGAGGYLQADSYSETVASLDGVAGSALVIGGGQTFTFGANNKDMMWDGTTSGGGKLVKLGTGTLDFGSAGVIADTLAVSNGVLKVDAAGDLGAAGTGTELILDNTRLRWGGGVANFIPFTRPMILGANVLLDIPSGSDIALYGGPGTIQGGMLTFKGPGEFRTYGAEHSFSKLVVSNGLYTAGHATSLGYNTSFGAIPASTTADAITMAGNASIRKAGGQNVFLDPKQGITLTEAGTKIIRAYSGNTNSAGWNATGTFGIPGTISGTGPLQWGLSADGPYTPIFVAGGNNTYTGDTSLAAGSLFVTNTTGSATGTGTLTVGAIGTNVLGGDGIIGGPVVMNAGSTIAPGYTFFLGAATPDPTVMTKPIARLTLGNGLTMSAAATNVWELGALSVANPGTDFDQIQVTGGNVTLGGSSVLKIAFTGTATAPSLSEPFWQANRQWKIIALSGGGSVSANFSSITGTNGITAGRFTTTTDATGVTLNFITSYSPLGSVTNMSIAAGPGSDLTISYSGGGGSQFVLLQTNNVAAPLGNWARVKTNSASPGSFVITPGSEAQLFYRVQSE